MRFVERQHTSPRIKKVLMTKHMLTMIVRWSLGILYIIGLISGWNMKVSVGSEIIGRQWKNHSNKRNSTTIYPLVKSRPFGSNFWFGEDIVIQQRNLEMKWFFNKFPYLHRQFYKVQWSYGAKRTLLSCFFGISSNSENMNCSVCDEWLEMIQKYHPRWR